MESLQEKSSLNPLEVSNKKLESISKVFTSKVSPYKKSRSAIKNGELPYELTMLLRQDMSHQDVAEFFKRISGIFSSFGVRAVKTEYWGLRNLQYRIKKSKKAHFYSVVMFCSAEALKEIDRVLRISNSVMRYITLKLYSEVTRPSPMITNAAADVADGIAFFDDNYVIVL